MGKSLIQYIVKDSVEKWYSFQELVLVLEAVGAGLMVQTLPKL